MSLMTIIINPTEHPTNTLRYNGRNLRYEYYMKPSVFTFHRVLAVTRRTFALSKSEDSFSIVFGYYCCVWCNYLVSLCSLEDYLINSEFCFCN